MFVWLSVWSKVQIVCIWSGCHRKIPSSLASFKSRLVLPFWCRIAQVVLEKRPFSGCNSSSASGIGSGSSSSSSGGGRGGFVGRERGRLGSLSKAVHARPLQHAVQQACLCAVGGRRNRLVAGAVLCAVLCVLRRRETGRPGDRWPQGIWLCRRERTHCHRYSPRENCTRAFAQCFYFAVPSVL